MAATSKQSAKVIALPTPATTAAFSYKHRLRKWIVWLVLALLVAAAGWYWRSYSQTEITFQTALAEHGSIQASIKQTACSTRCRSATDGSSHPCRASWFGGISAAF